MKEELSDLVASHQQGSLSRRQLAAALSAVTATAAAPHLVGGVASAQMPPSLPQPYATFIPGAAGGGADDYLPIQQAIDDAAAAGGGQVVFTQPLMTGSTLVVPTGVELLGQGLQGSSLTAHPSFVGQHLVAVEPDSHHVAVRDLWLDGAGRVTEALVDVGAGCNKLMFSGARMTGWDLSTPVVIGVRMEAEPDPSGSNTRVRDILIQGCEFHNLATGVKITQGASHISVVDNSFTGMRLRAIWLHGSGSLSSSYIAVVGNRAFDFPLQADMSNPIKIGTEGDEEHEFIHVIRNVVVGNGSFHGPGGFGTADHITLACVRIGHVICNVSVDSGESGFTLRDSNYVMMMSNAAVRSDVAGFAIVNKESKSLGLQFIGNFAWNNGQNRPGQSALPLVFSGFLMREPALGFHDTAFISNHAWDDQNPKTQNYALVLEKEKTFNTVLTGNFWRDTGHGIAAILNRGFGTREAQYDFVPRNTT